MRVIGYLRVSTDEQAQSGLGLDAQRAAIETEAERRGWTLDWREDAGASGKAINPGLWDALDLLARRQADALVVARMDRLARSVAHAADIVVAAQSQGWKLIVLDIGLDLTTPQGRAMAQMLAVFAEFEREMIGARTREALAARKARGLPVGRPRLASADVVHKIVTARHDGASFRAIADLLTADKVLSPMGRPTWQASTVRRIYNSAQKVA
jgi:DNA invertase Pin-like site-specific DNA recombinase